MGNFLSNIANDIKSVIFRTDEVAVFPEEKSSDVCNARVVSIGLRVLGGVVVTASTIWAGKTVIENSDTLVVLVQLASEFAIPCFSFLVGKALIGKGEDLRKNKISHLQADGYYDRR